MTPLQLASDAANLVAAAKDFCAVLEKTWENLHQHNSDPKAAAPPVDAAFLTVARGYAATALTNIANHAKQTPTPPPAN